MSIKDKSKKQLLEENSKLQQELSDFETAIIEMKLKLQSSKKNEEFLYSLLKSMDDLVFIMGLDGTFNRFYQEATREDLFLSPKKFLGKHVRDIFPQEIADLFQRALNAIETYGKSQEFNYSLVVKEKEQWFNAKISTFKSKTSDYFGYVCTIRNVSVWRQIKAALNESEKRYRAVMHQSMVSIFLVDIETRVILETNKALQNLLGYTSEELSGMSITDLIVDENDIYKDIIRILKERSYFVGDYKYLRKDGSSVDVEIIVNYINYLENKALCILSRDISPRRLSEEQLTHAATHDSLTGLLNRQYIYERLAQQLAMARRQKSKLALLYIDLDNFKDVNDTFGHGVGDQLLKAVAGRLSSITRREIDTLARMGGDEYMYIFGDIAKAEDAEKITRNVLQKIQNPFRIEEITHHITASIGISIFPKDAKDYESMIKAADLAMYFAKSEGRNNYKCYTSDMEIKDVSR